MGGASHGELTETGWVEPTAYMGEGWPSVSAPRATMPRIGICLLAACCVSLPLLWFLSVRHVGLNGSHGSWTMSDDVLTDEERRDAHHRRMERQAELRRQRMEAHRLRLEHQQRDSREMRMQRTLARLNAQLEDIDISESQRVIRAHASYLADISAILDSTASARTAAIEEALRSSPTVSIAHGSTRSDVTLPAPPGCTPRWQPVEFLTGRSSSPRDSALASSHGEITEGDDVGKGERGGDRDHLHKGNRGNAGGDRHGWTERTRGHGAGGKSKVRRDPEPPTEKPPPDGDPCAGQPSAAPSFCAHALRDPAGLCQNRNCRFDHPGEEGRDPDLWDEAIWNVGRGRYEVTLLVFHPEDRGLPSEAPISDGGGAVLGVGTRRSTECHPASLQPRVVWCDHKRGIQHVGTLVPGEPYGMPAYPGIAFRTARLDDGRLVPAIPAQTYLPHGVEDSGDGWVLLTPFSRAQSAARGFLQRAYTSPSWAHRSSGVQVEICTPWLRRVVHQHSSAKLDCTVGAAASAYMYRHYPVTLPGWSALARDTAAYAEESLGLRVMGRSKRVLLPDEVTASGPPEVMALHHAGNLRPSSSKIDPLADPLVVPYVLRDRARFFGFRGCIDTAVGEALPPQALEAQRDGIPFDPDGALTRSLPCFRTWGEPSRDPKEGRRFVELRGGGQQFVRYKTNTLDMYSALQRTLAARDDEDVLERAEARLWALAQWAERDRGRLWGGNPNAILDQPLQPFQPADLRPFPSLTSELESACRELKWPDANPSRPPYIWRTWRTTPRRLARECGPAEYGFHQALGVILRPVGPNTMRKLYDRVGTQKCAFGAELNLAKYSAEQWVYAHVLGLGPHNESLARWRTLVAGVEHEKLKLKLAMVFAQKMHVHDDYITRRVGLKLKPNEPAKFGKVTRITADLKAGSEYASPLPMYVKACIDGHHHWMVGKVNVHLFVALKPDKRELADLMRAVLRAAGEVDTVCALVHSDDKLLGVNIGGHAAVFNSDISGCDRSNRSFIHSVLWGAYARFCPHLATGLINQCRAPAEVVNPADPGEMFQVYPDGKGNVVQYSGSVNTTVVNTLASAGLVGAIAASLDHRRTELGAAGLMEEFIRDAATACGYKLTLTECCDSGGILPARMEFLKHSYVPELHLAYLQPAAVLRSFGRMHGGVTATRLGWTEEERAHRMRDPGLMLHRIGSMIVKGLVHEPPSTVIRALRERYNDPDAPEDETLWGYSQRLVAGPASQRSQYDHAGEAIGLVAAERDATTHSPIDDAMCARYGITHDDLDELARKIIAQPPGTSLSDYALTRMLEVDYGVTGCQREDCDRIGTFFAGELPGHSFTDYAA